MVITQIILISIISLETRILWRLKRPLGGCDNLGVKNGEFSQLEISKSISFSYLYSFVYVEGLQNKPINNTQLSTHRICENFWSHFMHGWSVDMWSSKIRKDLKNIKIKNCHFKFTSKCYRQTIWGISSQCFYAN